MSEKEYVKLSKALHVLDVVMSDDSIKHKGKAVRKRLKELPTVSYDDLLKKAKELQGDAFAGPLIVAEIEKEGAE